MYGAVVCGFVLISGFVHKRRFRRALDLWWFAVDHVLQRQLPDVT